MSATITAVKAFLKIPEGQRFIAGCLFVISISWGLNGKQWYEIKTLNKEVVSAEREKAAIERLHGIEIVRGRRECDSEKRAEIREARIEERERYRDVIAEGSRQMDQAIDNSNKVIRTQQQILRAVGTKKKDSAK